MKKTGFIILLAVAIAAFKAPKNTRVFLIGDSTMADKPLNENPERGWGQLLPRFFSDEISIRNHAVNGRSTKSFIREGRWDSVMKQLQKDDWVLIQFGHNDSKKEDTSRYAAPATTYRDNLVRFIKEARSKGANPVLVTPVMRRKFDQQGKFVDSHGDYPEVVRALAREMNVPLVDLHKSSQALIEQHGVEGSKDLFLWMGAGHYKAAMEGKKDDTHFSEYGAASVASRVCAELQQKNIALAAWLRPSVHPGKMEYELPKIYQPHFRKDTFDIRRYGAVSDGLTLNTGAINTAITDCSKDGGVVLIPEGLWLTGPIVMKSNVELHTQKGALVLFTPDHLQYPLVRSSFEGVAAARCQSPITAENLENIAITGKGIFHGSGDTWRPQQKAKLSENEWKNKIAGGGVLNAAGTIWYSSPGALKASITNNIGKLTPGLDLKDFEEIRDYLRPNMLRIANCRNIFIEGVTFENSPAWTMHLVVSKHITLKNVTVKNPWYGANTDAVDLESCSNILVDGCSFDTGDDGICIKSGRDEEGRKRGLPTENLIAVNTTVYRAHGGFVIGSEMSGGARNLFVSNCTFIGTDIGLRFKTVRGRGGVVEKIYASNIQMKDIAGDAISFDMYYAAKDPVPLAGESSELPKVEMLPVTEATPVFRDFHINNIVCRGAARAVFIRGIPEMNVKNLTLENMVIKAKKGIECIEGTDIVFRNVQVETDDTDPVVAIQHSNNILFDKLVYGTANRLFSVNGDRSGGIQVWNTDKTQTKTPVTFKFGAKESSLQFK